MFRKLITISILFASVSSCSPAMADDSFCATFGKIAASIMTNRQHGVDMSLLMSKVETDSPMNKMARTLIVSAYGTPRYTTDEYVAKSVADFSNDVMTACYTSGMVVQK